MSPGHVSMVGVDVGLDVGESVGISLGAGVGSAVGTAVGVAVDGVDVGWFVGTSSSQRVVSGKHRVVPGTSVVH